MFLASAAPQATLQSRNGSVSTGDDRAAFALLLMPFLIVAFSLGLAQSRRTAFPALPEIAAGAPAPIERVAIVPAPVAMPTPTVWPAPAIPAPNDVKIPGTIPRFPPPLPTVEALVRPAPAPNEIAIPGPPPRFPPPLAVVEVPAPAPPVTPTPAVPPTTIAALDVRPPAPIALPPPATLDPVPSPLETACAPSPEKLASFSVAGRLARGQRLPRLTGVDPETFGRRLSAAALAQTEDLVIYTARYQPMAYPMGDVLGMHGACIDVVIRAYRTLGIDLQEEIQRARPSRGDPNIDHRRTENMRRFLEKHGASLPVTAYPENYRPGDIVTYYRPFSRISTSHIAIVTDVLAATGRPMIVHNRGYGPQLEDALFVDRITGHYRYMGAPATPAAGSRPAADAKAPVVRASFPR